MLDQLWLNMDTHFRFFRRNRLLMAISLVMLIIMVLYTFPVLFYSTSVERFEQLNAIYYELNVIVMVVSASLGMFIISSHMKNRNIKMVLTKPCLPETWLASGLLASATVSFMLYMLILLFAVVVSLSLGQPFQPGYVYMSLYYFFLSVIFLSYLTFLTIVIHPALAIIVTLFLNEKSIYGLSYFTTMLHSENKGSVLLYLLNKLLTGVYMVLPMVMPFSSTTAGIFSSMRVGPGDWIKLVYTGGYALITGIFFFLLSDYFLKRKRLI